MRSEEMQKLYDDMRKNLGGDEPRVMYKPLAELCKFWDYGFIVDVGSGKVRFPAFSTTITAEGFEFVHPGFTLTVPFEQIDSIAITKRGLVINVKM